MKMRMDMEKFHKAQEVLIKTVERTAWSILRYEDTPTYLPYRAGVVHAWEISEKGAHILEMLCGPNGSTVARILNTKYPRK